MGLSLLVINAVSWRANGRKGLFDFKQFQLCEKILLSCMVYFSN